ncbi:MAG: ABC transporter permease [Nitrososphaerota archaeon]|nr:ABC transporter permease [Candidatus Bathyarchaeota archaeon]MDW8061830.1 ABC transporter permease [Nitrososphaerota archaeon]
MSFLDLLRAETKFMYADILRRRSLFFAILAYPYTLMIFVLLIGSSMGSQSFFEERVGLTPIIFLITNGFILMSMLSVMDDILWRPILDEFIGTMAYVVSSPTSRLKHYLAIPIPRLLLVFLSGVTSIIPVFTYYHGYTGFVEALIVLLMTVLASIFTIPVVLLLIGVIYGLGGGIWRITNVIRPILLIFTGVYYPRRFMPFIGRIICYAMPQSHMVEAIHLLLSAPQLDPVFVNILSLIGIATILIIVYSPLSYRSIHFWEHTKVKEGVKI